MGIFSLSTPPQILSILVDTDIPNFKMEILSKMQQITSMKSICSTSLHLSTPTNRQVDKKGLSTVSTCLYKRDKGRHCITNKDPFFASETKK